MAHSSLYTIEGKSKFTEWPTNDFLPYFVYKGIFSPKDEETKKMFGEKIHVSGTADSCVIGELDQDIEVIAKGIKWTATVKEHETTLTDPLAKCKVTNLRHVVNDKSVNADLVPASLIQSLMKRLYNDFWRIHDLSYRDSDKSINIEHGFRFN